MSEEKRESKGLRRAERSRGLAPFEEMERLFEDFFPPGWMRGSAWGLALMVRAGGPFRGAHSASGCDRPR